MSPIIAFAVCEDEREDVAHIVRVIREYGENKNFAVDVRSFASAEDMERDISLGARYDVYILDIYLGGVSGISLARRLRELEESCAICFLTCSGDHALEAFQVKAAHYLLKPLEKQSFFSALDRCREELTRRGGEERRSVAVRTQEAIETVAEDDILYIESSGKYQEIHLRDGRTLTARNSLQTFADGGVFTLRVLLFDV